MSNVQYSLYHNKRESELFIKRYNKIFYPLYGENKECYENGDVVSYNDCYYVCKDRKKLKEFAISIKDNWVLDLEHQLVIIKGIKI